MDTRRILWFAITMSTVVYAGVLFAIAGTPQRAFDESVKQPLTLAMYGAVLAMFVAGLAFTAVSKAPARTTMIVALGIFESCALLGFVAAILGSDWRLYIPAWIVALAGFVRQFPGEDEPSIR